MPPSTRSRRKSADRHRRLQFETLESRRLLTLPHGAMPGDLAEYLLGSTAVSVVFFESDGSLDANSEDWTAALIDETKDKIQTALDWWTETFQRYQVCAALAWDDFGCQALSATDVNEQAAVHAQQEIDFVVDWTYADDPMPTAFEPINRVSDDYIFWGSQFLKDVGFSGSTLTFGEDLVAFNHDQRQALGTDWAFTMFVANSEHDAGDDWAEGGSFTRAFAFPQEKLIVQPSGRPASTTAHEIAHMYWAFDEYAPAGTYFSTRGYYNERNENAHDNPTPGFVQVDSVMDREAGVSGTRLENAYEKQTSSPSSMKIIGWRDNDQDGIPDVLDVPHQIDGVGYYDPPTGRYEFHGWSRVQTLPNLNPRPSGTRSGSLQNDITLNQISKVEYRIDGEANPWEPWDIAASDALELDLSLVVPADFNSIEIRTRDHRTGAQSPSFVGSPDYPSQYTASGISGFVRYDAAADGLDREDVSGLSGWTVQLLDEQGQSLGLRQGVEPDDYDELVELNEVHSQVTLTAIGDGVARTSVYARTRSPASTGERVFAHALDAATISSEWTQRDRRLQMDFAEPIATLSLDAIANSDGDFGRLEIYSSDGQLLGRYTTERLDQGDVETMVLGRVSHDISYAIASAHLGTAVRLDNLQFGAQTDQLTNARGDFHFPYVPAGDYTLTVEPHDGYELTTVDHWNIQLSDPTDDIVNRDFGARLVAGANWQNPVDALDVSGDGNTSPIDVLLVVNHINNHGAHQLPIPPQPPDLPPPFLDVNGDDHVSPLDALLVVNYLNNQTASSAGEAATRGVTVPPVSVNLATGAEFLGQDLLPGRSTTQSPLSSLTIGAASYVTQSTTGGGEATDAGVRRTGSFANLPARDPNETAAGSSHCPDRASHTGRWPTPYSVQNALDLEIALFEIAPDIHALWQRHTPRPG